MNCIEEEKLIRTNLDLFNFQEEKERKFLEIWHVTKITMEEKLKYQRSLSEILLRCCSFLTFLTFYKEDGEEIKANQMEKFMKIENLKSSEHNGTHNLLFDLASLKTNHSRLLNLHDFFKFLKKIVRQNYENDKDFDLSSEIIKDFSFSDILYQKCEEFMNLFFDNHSPYFQNLKKVIWTCYIYSRAKLINHSRNLLECLPMLISVISIYLMDIEDQRFSQSFYAMIDSEVKCMSTQNQTSLFSYEKAFREKKKEYITNILYKKAGQRIDAIPQINQALLQNLREMPELRRCFLTNVNHQFEDINSKNFNLSDDKMMANMAEIFKQEYEKFLKFKHFDERIFLMEKDNSDCSPVKLTPFKRQKIMNQDFNIKKPTAFKTLDFDLTKKNTTLNTNFSMGINPAEDNLFNRPALNNFAMNINSQNVNNSNTFRGLDLKELSQKINSNVEMTPCTRVMYMDRWVKDYIKDFNMEKLLRYENLYNASYKKNELGLNARENILDVDSFITINLDKIQKLFSFYKVRVLTQIQEIKLLTLKIICGLIKRDERKFKAEFISRILSNPNFLKSALVVAVEIVLFIENVEEISFYKLADVLELDLYEFWKIINPFLNFDLTIPSDIRLHLNEIELQLMSFMIWKKASQNFKNELNEFLKDFSYFLQDKELKEIEDIEFNSQSLYVYQDQNIFSQENIVELMSPSSTTENSSTSLNYSNSNSFTAYKNIKPVYIFLRRILNYSIFLNKKITDNLGLNKETAKESEYLLKKIMNNKDYVEILFNRHIDQIIVCAIMGIMKIRNQFDEKEGVKSILAAYHKSKPDDSETMSRSLFHNIKIFGGNNSTNRSLNISEYYQEIFEKKLENLIRQLKDNEDDDSQTFAKKKRKFSVPDSEIRKFQFEDETAFESNTIMYEPLSKTIFSKNRQVNRISESPNMRNAYSSLRCSPMIGRYQSPSVNHSTPRTLRVRDAYTDYPSGPDATSLPSNPSTGGNDYKKKLQSMLSGSKPSSYTGILKHQISQLSAGNNSDMPFDNSITNSLAPDGNDLTMDLNMSFNNSQTTPEFNKIKHN